MRNRPEAIVLIGLPGAGKSITASAAVNEALVNIERDHQREIISDGSRKRFYMMVRDTPDRVLEDAVSQRCTNELRAAAKQGKNVIISDTNTNRFTRHLLYRQLFDLGFEVTPVLIDTDLDTCLARNSERNPDHIVPVDVIRRMHSQLEKDRDLIESEIEVLTTRMSAPPDIDTYACVTVFDIDGTLAQMHDRGPFEWHKVGNDLPRDDVVHLCQMYIDYMETNVVFFSGRDAVCFNETLEWLRENVSPNIVESELYMREKDDMRVDWIVKGEIMAKFIEETGLYPSLCVDDRQQVVDMWRNMGIQTWQVDAGKF